MRRKEMAARVRAVGPESSVTERAGAMLLGAYIPRTGQELAELVREAERIAGKEKPPDLSAGGS